MKKPLVALCLAGAALAPAFATDVGVSIAISNPGVYGRIDIGRYPQPQLIYAEPVVIARPVHPVAPVYMWVPPGHQKKWSKHCGRYNACGVPVYFVQEQWYQDHVLVPYEREHPGKGHGKGHDKGHGKDKH